MARRTITILLDPKVETPSAREFKFDPLSEVQARREHFVSLALTVVIARIKSDDSFEQCKAFASFSQWSHWIRQALLWLEQPDPVGSIFEQLASDPDRESLGRLIHAWNAEFGSTPTMIREAVRVSDPSEFLSQSGSEHPLYEAMIEVAEKSKQINRRALGRWIARHQGQIVDGLRFERARSTTSAERWMVKSVTTVLSETKQQNLEPSSEKSYGADQRVSDDHDLGSH